MEIPEYNKIAWACSWRSGNECKAIYYFSGKKAQALCRANNCDYFGWRLKQLSVEGV